MKNILARVILTGLLVCATLTSVVVASEVWGGTEYLTYDEIRSLNLVPQKPDIKSGTSKLKVIDRDYKWNLYRSCWGSVKDTHYGGGGWSYYKTYDPVDFIGARMYTGKCNKDADGTLKSGTISGEVYFIESGNFYCLKNRGIVTDLELYETLSESNHDDWYSYSNAPPNSLYSRDGTLRYDYDYMLDLLCPSLGITPDSPFMVETSSPVLKTYSVNISSDQGTHYSYGTCYGDGGSMSESNSWGRVYLIAGEPYSRRNYWYLPVPNDNYSAKPQGQAVKCPYTIEIIVPFTIKIGMAATSGGGLSEEQFEQLLSALKDLQVEIQNGEIKLDNWPDKFNVVVDWDKFPADI